MAEPGTPPATGDDDRSSRFGNVLGTLESDPEQPHDSVGRNSRSRGRSGWPFLRTRSVPKLQIAPDPERLDRTGAFRD